ncbi:dsDNA nuclease domain-containing protein [Acinetobacter baumannii]|uniref:dsDNA nuclease domain-containing protein n=3 Tax=Acinetobacter baumannii TaxID=470 RepID=UPI0038B5A16B
MNEDITNPLFDEQREKSGSTTFNKYRFQYNWALLHALEKFSLNFDHAVFMELHEDVISIDSVSKEPIEFNYYQVKCLTEKKLNLHKIAIEKKNGNTIFGKILTNYKNNSLRPNINSLNLVSQYGFNLNLKNPKIQLDKVTIDDLIEADQVTLEKCMTELELPSRPEKFFFITPKLQEKNQDMQVIGEISATINKLYPNKTFNPCSIYNILINNFYNKGCITTDYKNWTEALQNKSVTSQEIKKVVHTFIEDPLHTNLLEGFKDICDELRYNAIKKIKVKNAFNTLIIDNYNPTSFHLRIENLVKPLVLNLIESGSDDINYIIQEVKEHISKTSPDIIEINTEEELVAHIIFYILISTGV